MWRWYNSAAKSVLFAVAFHARKCFGAATPSELYDCIKHRGHITMILNLLIEKVAYSRHGPTSAWAEIEHEKRSLWKGFIFQTRTYRDQNVTTLDPRTSSYPSSMWLRFCNLFYKQILQNRSQTSIFSLAPIFVNLFSIKICKNWSHLKDWFFCDPHELRDLDKNPRLSLSPHRLPNTHS